MRGLRHEKMGTQQKRGDFGTQGEELDTRRGEIDFWEKTSTVREGNVSILEGKSSMKLTLKP